LYTFTKLNDRHILIVVVTLLPQFLHYAVKLSMKKVENTKLSELTNRTAQNET